ncbi:MAG TPA: DNA translocase FtsK [Gemmatimonadales bacterium]
MTADSRRRLGALTALVLGVFVGLTLLPIPLTGPVGGWIGHGLWHTLGVGAVGLPLLGIGLALAGFERLGRLDMKRAALLMGGLSLLVPYLIGVFGGVSHVDLVPDVAQRGLPARLVGLVPGLFSELIAAKVGVAGAVLLGFLALSALTLLTFAWHPLQRLEAGKDKGEKRGDSARRPNLPADPARAVAEPAPAQEIPGARASRTPGPLRGSRSKAAKETGPTQLDAKGPDPVWDVTLLDPPLGKAVDAGETELNALQERLEATLSEFSVEGDVAGRTTGPVVTQYGVRLRPGVKMSRLVALADDLALKMSARSVRVARIPGRDMVGVEVPNPKSRVVMLRELLESEAWTAEDRILPVALGLDLEGRPVIADLAKMPHLLIAGATGTGKSVGINAIITSLVYNYQHMDNLRLLMIDPKMVELSMYNVLPHLRKPVVTNYRDAARVLRWAVKEMEERYALLEANGARNIIDFNRKVLDGKPLKNPAPKKVTLSDIAAEPPDTPPPAPDEPYTQGKLPLIVLVVDELADLMMAGQADVEIPLARLAQKARAVGLHLIVATQRPSVNVITGLIKANFPCRIAFRVAQKVDSRTILDQNGAEALLGKGDMLFLEPGKSEPMRLQGAFISTEESEKLMARYSAWKDARKQAGVLEAVESDIFDEVPDADGGESGSEEGPDPSKRDPLFRDAALACVQNQGGSTSLLQRKLEIGYGRAARLMDQLEEAGILGPQNGSKPRDVRIGIDQVDEYCS